LYFIAEIHKVEFFFIQLNCVSLSSGLFGIKKVFFFFSLLLKKYLMEVETYLLYT